jgi:thioredoxin reductase (NADPH)
VIEKLGPGGQMATTELIENYPGFPEGIGGVDLSLKMMEQAERFGATLVYDEIQELEVAGPIKVAKGMDSVYEGRAVIIASGASPRSLGVPGEDWLRGRGVSYCATCDGALYRDKKVMVVGGGDSAVEEAVFLTRFATEVVIVHRRDSLRAAPILVERALANPKISIMYDTVVQAIHGDTSVQSVELSNLKSGEVVTLPIDGLFVYVGLLPNTGYLGTSLPMDKAGYILVDDSLSCAEGVFAAGDVRDKTLRQVATAVGDGAIAAAQVEKYLTETSGHHA